MAIELPRAWMEELKRQKDRLDDLERRRSMMKDPHVLALNYLIEHDDCFKYDEAKPLVHEEPEFRLEVKDEKARFEFKDHVHYATETDAQEAIKDFIRRWEFEAGLERGPGYFRLKYYSGEVVDRNPATKPIAAMVSGLGGVLHASFEFFSLIPKYPLPPSHASLNLCDSTVQKMYQRYMDDYRDPHRLTSMANFCLTVLEDSVGKPKRGHKRKPAAAKYNIDQSILGEIGRLCTKKGGRGARKNQGVDHELTSEDRQFLSWAVKQMIRRAAEKAHNPDKDFPEIHMSDFQSKLETAQVTTQ